MSRTVEQCNALIVNGLVTSYANAGMTIDPTAWSAANHMRLMCHTYAIAQSVGEQLQDVVLADMATIQAKSSAATPLWLQDKAFKFQYSATNPQALVNVNGVTQYATENAALRITKAAAVRTTITNNVEIKVAKNEPLEAFTSTELTAIQDYFNQVGAAGITYDLVSRNSDKLYIEADIYYQGLYSAVIQANVIAALDAYMLNLSKTRFGGDIQHTDLLVVIKGVTGVNDAVIHKASARYDSQALGAGVDLVLAGAEVNRKYTMYSGYIVQETTAGSTFADTLNFIAE